MKTTKIFQSGNSQAIRLPKEFRFNNKEVEIYKKGNEVIIREIPKNLGAALKLLPKMPKDFFADGRKDDLPQKRKGL